MNKQEDTMHDQPPTAISAEKPSPRPEIAASWQISLDFKRRFVENE
jgi:hypothetical protein